jgi:hypothetical protein
MKNASLGQLINGRKSGTKKWLHDKMADDSYIPQIGSCVLTNDAT